LFAQVKYGRHNSPMSKPSASAINERLSNLHSLDDVRQLIAKLGFAYRDEQLPTKSLPDELKSTLADNPRVIASAQDFIVGFIQLKPAKVKDIDRHMISLQRKLISKLPDEYQD